MGGAIGSPDPFAVMTQAVKDAMAKVQAEVTAAMDEVKAAMALLAPSAAAACTGPGSSPFQTIMDEVRQAMADMVDLIKGVRNALVQDGKDMAQAVTGAMADVRTQVASGGLIVSGGGGGGRGRREEGPFGLCATWCRGRPRCAPLCWVLRAPFGGAASVRPIRSQRCMQC